MIHFAKCDNIGSHWLPTYVKSNKVTYFDSFADENIPKEIQKLIINKNIETNISRIKADDLIMCGYLFIRSIN